jgi:hypothetical protein
MVRSDQFLDSGAVPNQHLQGHLPMPPHGNRKRHRGKDCAKRDQPAECGRAIRGLLCVGGLDRHDPQNLVLRGRRWAVSIGQRERLIYTGIAMATGFSL